MKTPRTSLNAVKNLTIECFDNTDFRLIPQNDITTVIVCGEGSMKEDGLIRP
jgi:hypothetical protein